MTEIVDKQKDKIHEKLSGLAKKKMNHRDNAPYHKLFIVMEKIITLLTFMLSFIEMINKLLFS